MIKKYLTLVTLSILLTLGATAQTYKLDTFRTEYVALDSFYSIALEVGGVFNWEKRFDLPFVFPYYDSLYTHIICDSGAKCYFEFNLEFDIKLMNFIYEYDNVLDPNNIESDVRYNYITKNGKQALVIQFTKIRLASDESIDEFDSYINFQLWLYDDGVMEVHFGDINLDNSPNYRPGEGFFIITTDGQQINIGPEMGVRHPTEEEDQTWLEGDWNDYLVYNAVGYLTTLPPKGFVIRFSKKLSATINEVEMPLTIFPNPTTDNISIEFVGHIKKTTVKSISGETMMLIEGEHRTIDTNKLNEGMYIIEIHTAQGIMQSKFVKL